MNKFIAAEAAECIGCHACEIACAMAHNQENWPLSHSDFRPRTRQQIVKCDLCEQREEGPACVESCPTQALQLLTERELRRVRQQRIVASGENPL